MALVLPSFLQALPKPGTSHLASQVSQDSASRNGISKDVGVEADLTDDPWDNNTFQVEPNDTVWTNAGAILRITVALCAILFAMYKLMYYFAHRYLAQGKKLNVRSRAVRQAQTTQTGKITA